jgi:hypothetical protein
MGTVTASLYDSNSVRPVLEAPNPRPDPWTIETASVETIDNDRAALMLDAGVVR